MPVAHLYLTQCTDEQQRELLVETSRRYADVLDSPIERVRVFVHRLDPASCAFAGVPADESGATAPYYEALMLQGRPAEQRTRLLGMFTDVLVEILGADRDTVRGLVTEIDPATWAIAGVPASVVRANEIAARAAAD